MFWVTPPPSASQKAIKAVANDSANDGVLVILTPQDMTDPTQTAEAVKSLPKMDNKPLLTSWMGEADVAAGRAILSRAGIPTFHFPDAAARAFTYMWRYTYNLRGLYETPAVGQEDAQGIDRASAQKTINSARASGNFLLDEFQSKKLLAAYGIPVVKTVTAMSSVEAVQAAETVGFPVVLKLFSHTITHKTDVGGVKLNLANSKEVVRAFDEIGESVGRLKGPEHFKVSPSSR